MVAEVAKSSVRFADKAYIYNVWLQGEFDMTLKEFKNQLFRCHQSRLVRLSRADLCMAFDAHYLCCSEINVQGSRFHFIEL